MIDTAGAFRSSHSSACVARNCEVQISSCYFWLCDAIRLGCDARLRESVRSSCWHVDCGPNLGFRPTDSSTDLTPNRRGGLLVQTYWMPDGLLPDATLTASKFLSRPYDAARSNQCRFISVQRRTLLFGVESTKRAVCGILKAVKSPCQWKWG